MLGCLIVALLNVENESKFFFEYSTLVVFIKFTQKQLALLSTDATKKGPRITRQQQNTDLKKYYLLDCVSIIRYCIIEQF